MATHSSILAWRLPGTGEPGGLPSMGSHRVGHNWCDLAAAAANTLYYSKQWDIMLSSWKQMKINGFFYFWPGKNHKLLIYCYVKMLDMTQVCRMLLFAFLKINKIMVKNIDICLCMHKISLQQYTKTINSIVVQETEISMYAFLNCDSYPFKKWNLKKKQNKRV